MTKNPLARKWPLEPAEIKPIAFPAIPSDLEFSSMLGLILDLLIGLL
jgi:hypothetical protein